MHWQKCIEPSRSYTQDEIARLVGVDPHQVACSMQVGIIRGKQRGGGDWCAKGDDLLEWSKTPFLFDDVMPDFDLSLSQPAKVTKRAPKPAQEALPPPPPPVIYFARCGDHIKIGFTRGKPEQRLKYMKTANPLPIELIATMPGGQALEAELHERFSAYRTKGEWFVFADPIRAYIDSIED